MSQRIRAVTAFVLVALVSSGCSVLGMGNPRADLPNITPPTVPDEAVSWSSLDWQKVTFEDPPNVSQEQWDKPDALASGPGGWVAVGSNGNVLGYDGRIWQSTDSLSWQLVESDLLPGLELVDVAATTDAYVAIGTASANPNAPVTSILRSSDGSHWSETKTISGAWASRVAAGPNGFAVLVQVDETNDLLLSTDGRAWDRVPGGDFGEDVWIADIAWDVDGWIAVGSAGVRAVVFLSPDGRTWTEERLPASEPVEGIIDVSAYSVVPGRWATLVLGLDRAPSCAEDDDWCPKYQVAWSWTADTGWLRLPSSNWLLDRGYGVDAFAAGDAGFLYLLDADIRTSADGWNWSTVEEAPPSNAFARDVVVKGDQVVAAGIPVDGDVLTGWFGSAVIRPGP